MSAIRYISLPVTNKLEARFDAIAVGNNVVTYNTSSGSYNTAVWKDADGNVITDNQRYAQFSAESFPVTVRLEVSDGKQTQFTEQTIELNNKLRAFLRKSNEPIVLTNISGDAINPTEVILQKTTDSLYIYT